MKTNNEDYNEKKTYSKPELAEWGTLTKLTHGGFSGVDDTPLPGASAPVFGPPPQ